MRIGITCYPTYGGSGVVATELGISLARKGHEVHFISYEVPVRLHQFVENVYYHAVEVPGYPLFKYPPYCLALASKMHDVARESGLDLLHVHYAIPHAISAYLSRQMLGDTKLKIVTTLHGTDIVLVGADSSYKSITRYGLDMSDGVTSVSEWLKGETMRIFEPKREIAVIPNFVDTERFAPRKDASARRRFARPEEGLLAHVSNFRPVKRTADVIEIFARVRAKTPARLMMIGDGPDKRMAEKRARESGVGRDVLFLGSQHAVHDLLPLADIFLLPSEFESFGLSNVEAMACGVPVISTLGSGIGEAVSDGVEGFLCKIGDVETMAERAKRLLADADMRARMAQAARRRVKENYSRESATALYEKSYESVLAKM